MTWWRAGIATVIADQIWREARLHGARRSFLRREDDVDRGVARDMRELRRAEECRQPWNDDLPRHRTAPAEQGDCPMHSVWREDSHHARVRIDLTGENGDAGQKLAAGKRAIRIAERKGIAILARTGAARRQTGIAWHSAGCSRERLAARGGLVMAKTRGCSA